MRWPAFLGVVAALALPASGAFATTAPGNHVLLTFVISDKNVAYQTLRTTAGGGTDQLFPDKFVQRGDWVTVTIVNRSHKPHGFTFYGHRFKLIKPGHRTRFATALLHRGSFAYASTPAAGKAFRGKFSVV